MACCDKLNPWIKLNPTQSACKGDKTNVALVTHNPRKWDMNAKLKKKKKKSPISFDQRDLAGVNSENNEQLEKNLRART